MRTNGYIKIPRSLQALPPSARLLMIHLCTETYHCEVESASQDESLEAWSIITSRGILCKEVGLTIQELKTALRQLTEADMISVEAAQRFTKITITWADFLSLNSSNIMLNNPTANPTANPKHTLVTCADTERCNGQKKSATQPLTQSATQPLTHLSINNSINNNITHTSNINLSGRNKSAGARIGAHVHTHTNVHTRPCSAEVAELSEWITKNVPEFLLMAYPFTDADLQGIIDHYPAEDVHRILLSAWSKGGCVKQWSAMNLFRTFAERDYRLKEKQPPTAEQKEKLYTYEEMCDWVSKYRTSTDKAFTPVPQPNGKPLWKRITN